MQFVNRKVVSGICFLLCAAAFPANLLAQEEPPASPRIFTGRYDAKSYDDTLVVCRVQQSCVIRMPAGEQIREVRLDDLNWRKELGTGVSGRAELTLEPMGPEIEAYMEIQGTRNLFRFQLRSEQSEINRRSGMRVVPYFAGTATRIFCPTYRRCSILLEPGEQIERTIGADQEFWKYEAAYFGASDARTATITIQPKTDSFDVDAGLMVFTNRRLYNLVILATTHKRVPYVTKFWYPEDAIETFAVPLSEPTGSGTPPVRNLAYCLVPEESEGPSWRPLAVYDDGAKTHIQFPESVRTRELPSFVVIDSQGAELQVNDRFSPDELIYTVDRLFDTGRLRLGTGRFAEEIWVYGGNCEEHSGHGNRTSPGKNRYYRGRTDG